VPEESPSATLDRELTANIVAVYVCRNQIGDDQLPVLISTVHQGARRSRKIESESSPKHAARKYNIRDS
jgi:predicted transcriptional regulator